MATIANTRRSSAVFTQGATVVVDASDLSFSDLNHSDTEGLWYCEFQNVGYDGASANRIGVIGLGTAGRLMSTSGNSITSDDGPNLAGVGVTPPFADGVTEYRAALAYGSGTMSMMQGGFTGSEQAYDGQFDGSLLMVSKNSTFLDATPVTQFVRDFRRYALSYADSVVKGEEITAP